MVVVLCRQRQWTHYPTATRWKVGQRMGELEVYAGGDLITTYAPGCWLAVCFGV